ncbi:MAG TPA: NHLP leader peptide family RiPP precursor [Gemmatimonadaceae bacterium]|jgi:TOMM propeptide domain
MQTFPEQYVAKRLEREEQVLNRALQDADFRKELVASPRATLSSLYGVSIPDEADVQVFEETTNSHHVVIPPDLAQMNEELTDEQLEAVAGGWFLQLAWTTLCVGSGKPGDTN